MKYLNSTLIISLGPYLQCCHKRQSTVLTAVANELLLYTLFGDVADGPIYFTVLSSVADGLLYFTLLTTVALWPLYSDVFTSVTDSRQATLL